MEVFVKLLFISLGCDKNLADSEEMLGILQNRGYEFTDDEQEAEIIIINSCCFIQDAKEESINTILEMAQCKIHFKCKVLMVTGCLAQRYQEEIYKEIPEVDAILGTSSFDAIAEALEQALEGEKPLMFGEIVTGWCQIDGNWHYFYPDSGEMASNTSINGFYVDADGIWR